MIDAKFFVKHNGVIQGFHITGHSGMADYGNDVLCAFVSSAAYMAANTVTEVIRAEAEVFDKDGEMYVYVSENDVTKCSDVLNGLKLHLDNTMEQYPNYLNVYFTEV